MKVFQPIDSIQELELGDIIINKGSSNSYIVIIHHGSHVTAIKAVDVYNPTEWSVYKGLKVGKT